MDDGEEDQGNELREGAGSRELPEGEDERDQQQHGPEMQERFDTVGGVLLNQSAAKAQRNGSESRAGAIQRRPFGLAGPE